MPIANTRNNDGTFAVTHGLSGQSGIYQITCTANLVVYIGSAINLPTRWSMHRYQLRNGKHASRRLQRAWNKYGEGAFVFDVLLVCCKEELIEREQDALDQIGEFVGWRNMFNTLRIAGSSFGYKHSEVTRAKMTAFQQSRGPLSEETRQRIALAHTGAKRSTEACARISAGIRASGGRSQMVSAIWASRTPEQRDAIKQKQRKPKAPETVERMKAAQSARREDNRAQMASWWKSLSAEARADFVARRAVALRAAMERKHADE